MKQKNPATAGFCASWFTPEVYFVLLQGNRYSEYMYYVYVLLCADEKFYIGYSTDLKKRIERHKRGLVFATKGRLPVQLIFYEAFLHKLDAKRRERYFKTNPGKKTLNLMLRRFLKK